MPDMAGEEEDRAYTSSCCSDGVEYRLYDIVKIYDRKFRVPHIAKILKMWEERSSGTHKALVCWFFLHKEVKPENDDNPRELFLASGNGVGVTNELYMDSIVGKCKVVCTSNDPRNTEPSASVKEHADFVFTHAYDVDLKHTVPVEIVADKLGPDVIFNTQEWLIAITKTEEEFVGSETYISVRSPILESKKRPRAEESVTTQQKKKITKLEDLTKGNVNLEETSKKGKVKVSDGKAPVPKEKAREESSVQKEEVEQSKRKSFKSDIVSGLNKATNGDVKEPAASEGSDLDMASTPRKHSLDKVDIQRESKKEGTVREAVDEALPREKTECEDNEKQEFGPSRTLEEGKPQAEEDEAADLENDLSDKGKVFKKAVTEVELASKVDLGKDNMSKIAKRIKSLASDKAAEKRVVLPAEMAKPFEKRRIFRQLPWEENLRRGIPLGKVLHLQNIDPSITSADIREMLHNAVQGLSDARVLPKETICPSGQAVAIFESERLADSALEDMDRDCLVMADRKWPVIASKVKESENQTRFPGHLALEKLKFGRHLVAEDYRKAVSTSHCSQPNTIEFEMAMEWRQMQEVAQNCRMELFKKQRKELNDLRNRSNSKAQRPKQDGGVG